MNLRPYQQQIIDKTLETLAEVGRALIVSPTGSGKTIVFAKLAQLVSDASPIFTGTRTLVLVNREQLLQQARDKIARATGLTASIERADDEADMDATVVVATVQSISRRLAKYAPDHFGLVVVDEAHVMVGKQAQAVMSHFQAKLAGFTATPQTKGKKALANFYDKIAIEIKLLDLIQQGYLCTLTLQMMPLPIDLSGVRIQNGDFMDEDLDDVMTPHFDAVIDEMLLHNRKWIVFVPLIKSSLIFQEKATAKGLRCLHLDATVPNIQEKLADFAKWQNGAVVCPQLLSYGYDEPSLTGICNLRPTRSQIFYQQAIGRVTRIHPGKTDALILDPMYHGYKHKIIRPTFLLAKDEEEEELMQKHLRKGRGGSLTDAHDKMKRELEENMKRKARKLDMLMLSMLGDDPVEQALLEYEPIMKWEAEPATVPQLMSLTNAGIEKEIIKNKGHASKLMDLLKHRRENGLATYKQCRLLAKLYVAHDPKTVKFDEASKLIDEALGGKNRPPRKAQSWLPF